MLQVSQMWCGVALVALQKFSSVQIIEDESSFADNTHVSSDRRTFRQTQLTTLFCFFSRRRRASWGFSSCDLLACPSVRSSARSSFACYCFHAHLENQKQEELVLPQLLRLIDYMIAATRDGSSCRRQLLKHHQVHLPVPNRSATTWASKTSVYA